MSQRTADSRGIRRARSSSTGAYRGPDRRRTPTEEAEPLGKVFWLSALLVVIIWALFTLAGTVQAESETIDTSALRTLLEGATATLALIAGALSILRWRLAGEAKPLWLGVALVWFGFVTIGLATLLPTVQPQAIDPAVLDWLRAGSRLAVIAALGYAALSPEVDSRIDIKRAFAPLFVATVSLTVLLQLVPGAGRFVVGASEQVVHEGAWVTGSLVIFIAWMLAGTLHLRNGVRHRRPFFAWAGLMLLGLGLAEVTRAAMLQQPDIVWSMSAEIVRGIALLCGLTGVTVELQRSFTEQQGSLMQTMVSALATESRMRAEQAKQEEVAHEARNALAAIEGATQALEHYRDHLPPETREQLTLAVSVEIGRLQRLVSRERYAAEAAPFNLAEAIAPVITSARAQGMLLHIDVPGELVAFGRWADTAEVVQNLLANARRYAPHSPVALYAYAEDARIVVRVEDRGPGVADDERERIFRRGQRGAAATDHPGSGLGLYVSAELMREQDGELWVDNRAGGGASFALTIPASGGPAMSALDTGLVRAEPLD